MSEAPNKVQPLFLVVPGSISPRDKHRAEKLCGICIVECKDTAAARYSEPPLGANLDEQARAALTLMRRITNHDSASFLRGDLVKWYVQELFLWDNKPEIVKAVPKK